MHDLVIRNGTVVDGTGAARRGADVAGDGDLITAVGGDIGRGRREIDARGLLVTPGFVDIHTHYDGQATWDPYLTPSSWHGVTTVVFGNCGVGFAPVRKGAAPYLINLMEGVEDIPGTLLAAGVKFNWESFPDYLGALGFTTSRTIKHRAADGRSTPSLSAGEPELFGLAAAMKRAGRGVIEVNSDFGPGEFEILRAAAQISGRPLSVLLLQVNNAPDLWRQTRGQIHAARKAGVEVNGQVGCRPIGIMMGLETTIHPFSSHPAWLAMHLLTPAQRVGLLKHDPALRRKLVGDRPADDHTRRIADALNRIYVVDDTYDYEPHPSISIGARAQAAGVSPWSLALDAMMERDGKQLLVETFENYTEGSLNNIREMLEDEATVMGIADGGAHVCTVCDASSPTFLLTHWARDRKRGAHLPLEFLVRKQTRYCAQVYGLKDRGVLAPGYRADFNIIDFDRLGMRRHEVVYDLPAGGRRLMQRADGYRYTFVAGVETLCDDEHTGAMPGRLLR